MECSNSKDSVPIVKCLTSFCSPTLFDNRNLLFSIISHNWIKNKNLSENLYEIITSLPKFVDRIIENTENRVLVYYGDYKIDSVYDVNDFILNNTEVNFFKVHQMLKNKKSKDKTFKDRYIILTDIYFLLFDPLPNSKNLGKLLFWGDIRQLSNLKGISEDTMVLEWSQNGKTLITFEIAFNCESFNCLRNFNEKASKKINRLKEFYKIFQDDINKPDDEPSTLNKSDSYNDSEISKLKLLIKYKEDLLINNSNSENLIRELMSLYQKIIEKLSLVEDLDFKNYLEKLHKMLMENDAIVNQSTDFSDNGDDLSKLDLNNFNINK